MPCLQDWRPSPRGQPTLPLKFAACHAGVMVTLAAAACRTCTSTSPLHAPTRERTQSWCCRLHGNLSHRDMTTLSHLTRTRSFCLKMHHPTYRNLLFTRFSTWNPPLFFLSHMQETETKYGHIQPCTHSSALLCHNYRNHTHTPTTAKRNIHITYLLLTAVLVFHINGTVKVRCQISEPVVCLFKGYCL